MRPWLLASAAILFSGMAQACVERIDDELKPELEHAIELRESGEHALAEPAFARLEARAPDNFCILYEYGRLLVQEEEYDRALALLDRAVKAADDLDLASRPIYNMRGFIQLKRKDFDTAAEEFEAQKTWIPKLPDKIRKSTEVKVYNNTGWAYLQQDRYDQAELNFLQAETLGSKLATRNLEVTRSIRSTIESQDIETGGVFAAIAKSSRAPLDIEKAADKLKEAGIPADQIRVFRRDNGMLSLTYGAYLSYPKAQRFQDELMDIYLDSYVASISPWTDVTEEFFGNLSVGPERTDRKVSKSN
ncbi:MAG: tetratricopeptide repeat protein [Pseudomonadota bacterium]